MYESDKKSFNKWFGFLLASLSVFFLLAFFFDLAYRANYQKQTSEVAGTEIATTTITNSVTTSVSSGGNTTSGSGGSSSIQTGSTSVNLNVNGGNTSSYTSSGTVRSGRSTTGGTTGGTTSNTGGTTTGSTGSNTAGGTTGGTTGGTGSQTPAPSGTTVQTTVTDPNGQTATGYGTADDSGHYNVPVNTSNLSDGPLTVENKDVSDQVSGDTTSSLSEGQTIDKKTVTKKTTIPKVSMDAVISPTKKMEITLTGVKDPDTALWFNGKEIMAVSKETTWSYKLALKPGENDIEVYVKDVVGNKSDKIKTVVVQSDKAGEFAPVPRVPNVASGTHPYEDQWYASKSVTFSWTKPEDVNGFAYVFDQSPKTEPMDAVNTVDTKKGFVIGKDGVWYFHLKAQNLAGWGGTKHFKVQLDTTPPEAFEVGGEQIDAPVWETFKIYFEAKDATSGVGKYLLKVNDGNFTEVSSPYTVALQKVGAHTIIVKAIDKAGNSRESSRTIQVTERPVAPKEPVVKLDNIDKKPLAPQEPVIVTQGKPVPISGKAPANSSVLIFIFSKPVIAVVKTDSQGKWTYVIEQQLTPGAHTIYTTAIDAEGVVSPRVKLADFTVQAAQGGIGTNEQVRLIRNLPGTWSFLSTPVLIVIGILIIFATWFWIKRTLSKPGSDKFGGTSGGAQQ